MITDKNNSNQSKSKLPHLIGYLRVSKESNSTGSFTFETQKQRIIEYCDRKYGAGNYQITFLEDDGLSGGYGLTATALQRNVRPTLRTIADMLKAGNYAGVVVYGQSRFFRNIRGLAEMVEDILLPLKVPLMSATEEIDIFTADGRMMLYMKGLFDEKQREDIIKRNKDAAASRVEAGYVIGQIGYGWGWEPKSDVKGYRRNVLPITEEREWIIWMKDRYLSGWNTYQIAAELNRLGVPTPMQRKLWSGKAKKHLGKNGVEPKWTNSTVANVLCNPLHAGMVKKQSGELIQGQHFEHRFFEREIHEAIVEAMKERARRFKTCSGGHKTLHLLSGMIYCERCGNPLRISSSGENEKNYRSYKCANGQKQGLRTCPNVVVRAQWVEEAIVEEIAKLSDTPQMQGLLEKEVREAVGKQNSQMEKEITQLQKKLDQFDVKFERWAEGFMNQTMSEKRFKKINQQMEIEQAGVQRQLDSLLDARENEAGRERHAKQVREQFRNFPKVWEHLDNIEKRQLLALLIEEGKLTVDRTGRDILIKIKVHFLPERERIILYRTFRGINRTLASGVQRLTLRQMVLLHYAGQGKSRTECAELMGCKVHSIYSIEKVIRKNLGGVSWKEAVEMTRERVEANVAQLPLGHPGKNAAKKEESIRPFISPVLMEVFELFAKGATVPEAAERLGLPAITVQGRRSRILKSMGTSSMLDATERARDMGILVS